MNFHRLPCGGRATVWLALWLICTLAVTLVVPLTMAPGVARAATLPHLERPALALLKPALTPAPTPFVKAKIGQRPLSFAAKDLSGKPLSLTQYRGKVVLVDFWATWCAPCVRELPNVKAAYARHHARGFEVVGISFDQEQADLKTFIAQKKLPWRQVWDGYFGPISTIFHVEVLPANMLIDRQGRVVALNVAGKQLELALRKALAKR